MGVTDAAVQRLAAGGFPDIGVIARGVTPPPQRYGRAPAEPPGPVKAVRLTITGIRGGRGPDRLDRCSYLLILDVTNLAGDIPPTWVRSPADRDIRHVNIWPGTQSHCPWAGGGLPSLCWHTFSSGWLQAPPSHRTLGNALEYAKQLLNTENHVSPAR
jgi:hypothetical protein